MPIEGVFSQSSYDPNFSWSYGSPQSRGSAERTAGAWGPEQDFWDIWQGLILLVLFLGPLWGILLPLEVVRRQIIVCDCINFWKDFISVLVALRPQFRENFWTKRSREIETKLNGGNLTPERRDQILEAPISICRQKNGWKLESGKSGKSYLRESVLPLTLVPLHLYGVEGF